jgi:hypothetical protein
MRVALVKARTSNRRRVDAKSGKEGSSQIRTWARKKGKLVRIRRRPVELISTEPNLKEEKIT